jgi:MYXO-CTERM domain-containing protein
MRRSPLLAIALLLVSPARARADVTTTPYPGVTHLKHVRGAERWHVVTIELATKGLSIHLSSEASRGKKLSEIAADEHAQIAINGQIFRKDYTLCGVGLTRGAPWSKVDDNACGHAIGWSGDLRTWALFTGKGLGKGPFPAAVTDATGGYPTLVRGGVPCDGSRAEVCAIPPLAPADFKGPNPRTFLGVDEKRTKAFLVVIDGRELGAATGMSLVEGARFMAGTVGAWDAVNLDGGGSSELFVASEGGVANAPSDGAERVIADAIVVSVPEPASASASASAAASAGDGGSPSGKRGACGCDVPGGASEPGLGGAGVIAAGLLARGRRRGRARWACGRRTRSL